MNDKEVVRCFKEREQKGIEILIDKYGKLIYGVIKYTINKKDSESDFEDIFYEVLMKIWDSIIEYDEEKSVLRNFIISITKYTAIDYIRKVSRRRERYSEKELDNDLQYCTYNYDCIIEQENFDELLGCLSDFDREIFIRRYYFDEEIATIAVSLNKSEDYIYTRLSRGRKKIKEELGGVRNVRQYNKEL